MSLIRLINDRFANILQSHNHTYSPESSEVYANIDVVGQEDGYSFKSEKKASIESAKDEQSDRTSQTNVSN